MRLMFILQHCLFLLINQLTFIGEKLVSEIGENINNNADYTNYISILPSVETRFQFKCITDNDT